MTLVRQQILELVVEFPVFLLLGVVSAIAISESPLDSGDLLAPVAIWITTVLFRVVFLQLPAAWAIKAILFRFQRRISTTWAAAINASSFLGAFWVVTMFNEVVASFVADSRLLLPIICLLATTLSPGVLLVFKRGLGSKSIDKEN